MNRVLCTPLPETSKPVCLGEEESHHLLKVLRAETGAKLLAIDGQGSEILAELEIKAKRAWLHWRAAVRSQSVPKIRVFLEVSILKNDSFSWLIEKAVELGCTDFIPLQSERTVVRMKAKEPAEFQARWRKIADQALKQCGRLWSMKVHAPEEIGGWLAQNPAKPHCPRWICDEKLSSEDAAFNPLGTLASLNSNSVQSLHILIGPEGGWGETERALLAIENAALHRINLGPTILRAETAALYCLGLVRGYLHNQGQLDKFHLES